MKTLIRRIDESGGELRFQARRRTCSAFAVCLGMLFAGLSLLWAGSAVGRLVSGILDGHTDPAGVQLLLLEVMMGLTLSLPFWASRQITAGPTLSV